MSTHPFDNMSELIDKFVKNKDKMTVNELQTLREDLSLSLFYLSDSASQAISNYESSDYERKRYYATREEYYRNTLDERTGKNHNVADSERLARIDMVKADEKVVKSLRQKERVRIIITAVGQILNSISGRINQINKNDR